MQSKLEIELWWSKPDAWGYKTNPDDLFRKETILEHIKGKYKRALDIGAGEGWITKDLPAKEIDFIEWSDTAASRVPAPLKRVFEPKGKYDLIVATGVLYEQYDWQQMIDWIKKGTGTILISNIKDWEKGIDQLKAHFGEPTVNLYFPYRQYTQHLMVWQRD